MSLKPLVASLVIVALWSLPAVLPAATGPACFRNTGSQTLYFSVRWTSGISNFVLKPGEDHRLNNMNDQDTYVCRDTESILGDTCPNQARIVINNCGS